MWRFVFPFLYIAAVNAWWDEGHLLVAAIAKLQLSKDEIDILETPLRKWESQYPAAVWPDHIKCGFPTPFCRGMPMFDALEIFNQWHYVSKIYNPQNIELDCLLSQLPFPTTGAVWALTELLNGVPNIKSDGSKWDYRPTPSLRSGFDAIVGRSNRHESESPHYHGLSEFSWNLRLRLLVHIFGDLHQPMHAIETFSRRFPLGDRGATEVHIDVSDSRLIPSGVTLENVHSLWDSCGGLFSNSWPTEDEEKVLKEAKILASKFPHSYFESRLVIDSFEQVAQDSYSVAKDSFYSDFDWTSDEPYGELPFRPSERLIESIQKTCREQIVLGGYRLAFILKDIANAIQSVNYFNPTE